MPKDKWNTSEPFYWGNQVCDYCEKDVILFKIINQKKVMCDMCFYKKTKSNPKGVR